MRIRTVKPEFWANEKLATLPEFTRLVALALLNYADDEGFFNANVSLIRGSLFPFGDESGRIRGALGELSRQDYLRLGKGSDGREYGWIVHFADHQKVEKPKPSKIKGLASFPEASGTSRGCVGDTYPLEQGTGNREQGSGNGSLERPRGAAAAGGQLQLDDEQSNPPKRSRDPLFDALAIAEGCDPTQLTKSAARTIGVALAEIKKACPALTPEEIARRMQNFKAQMPTITHTASGLAKHWARCDYGAPNGATSTYEQEKKTHGYEL